MYRGQFIADQLPLIVHPAGVNLLLPSKKRLFLRLGVLRFMLCPLLGEFRLSFRPLFLFQLVVSFPVLATLVGFLAILHSRQTIRIMLGGPLQGSVDLLHGLVELALGLRHLDGRRRFVPHRKSFVS
jgi:hypothetical protein